MLRPGELLALTWGDVELKLDAEELDGYGAVAIRKPKTRFVGGRIQRVLVCCPWPSWFLVSLRDILCPGVHDRISCYSYAVLLKKWNQALTALQVPWQWTPASLRAGGTTHLYRCRCHLEWIRHRGRWAVPSSMEHYIQEAVAWALTSRLPDERKQEIAARASTFWLFAEAALQELVTDVANFRQLHTDMNVSKQPADSRRVLAYRVRLRELREALAADFQSNLT